MKRFNFAWINIIIMVILAIVIFINRSSHFYNPRSIAGYVIYAVFVITAILAILGIIMTLLNANRARQKTQQEPADPPSDPESKDQ